MLKKMTKPLSYAILGVACLVTAPIAASAQDASSLPTAYIDVFQDGTLFITYEEYLERQRRVEAARVASLRPLAAPTRSAPITAQVARTSNTMGLRDQWQIGAFR